MVINVLVTQDIQKYKESASKKSFLLVVTINSIAINNKVVYVMQVLIELQVHAKNLLIAQ